MDNPELGVTEMAKILGLSKSAVHRLMLSMGSEGFVHKDAQTNRYSLGTSILALTNIVNYQLPIINESIPILNLLTERTGETALLGILEGTNMIYLQKIESENPVKPAVHIGMRLPIHCTCSGQVVLAFQNEETIAKLVPNKLEQYTSKTVGTREELEKRLTEIKRQKYAICVQEYCEDYISIGAPVWDNQERVIAAVSIVGPVQRLKKKQWMIEEVKTAGQNLSEIVKKRKKKGLNYNLVRK